MTQLIARDDRVVQGVERSKQRGRAVAFVIVGHRGGTSFLQGQPFIESVLGAEMDAHLGYSKHTKAERKIYSSLNLDEAEQELRHFGETWDKKYAAISKSWHTHWPNLVTLFDYPDEIRKVIYTTNAIESLNSMIRKAIKNRKIFPQDSSALKVVWLAIQAASKKWTMPLRLWNVALNQFMMEYQGRLPKGF